MSYYLLNHVSTEVLVLIIVGIPTMIAMIAVYWVDKVFARLREVEIDDTVREVVGLLFGLLLALVIASIVTKQDDAESAAAAESTATAQLTRATRAFPVADQIKFERSINQYIHAVVEDEWPAMRSGGRSVRADAALESIYGTFQAFRPTREPAISVYRQALIQLDEVTANRRERLDLSSQSLPPLLRVLLIFGAISFILLSYPAQVEDRRKRMAITGAITAFICFAYFLTIVLDHPFSGEIAVSNASFKEGDLSVYWAGETPPIREADVVALTARTWRASGRRTPSGPPCSAGSTAGSSVRCDWHAGRSSRTSRRCPARHVVRGAHARASFRLRPGRVAHDEVRWLRPAHRPLAVRHDGPVSRRLEPHAVGDSTFEPQDVVTLFDTPSRFCGLRPTTTSEPRVGLALMRRRP